jgi:hypothetical protein
MLPPDAIWQNCSSDRNTVITSPISHTSWEALCSKAVQVAELLSSHPHHDPYEVELDTGEVLSGFRLSPMHEAVILADCQSVVIQPHGQTQYVRITQGSLIPDLYRKIDDTLNLCRARALQPVQQQFS